jgi:hypothetical protein
MVPLSLFLAIAAPKFALSARATPLLGGHLAVRLPVGAKIEAPGHSVMAAPEASEDVTRAVLDSGKVRVVMMAMEQYALVGVDFEAGVRAQMKAEPGMADVPLAPFPVAAPLRAIAVFPGLPQGNKEAHLVYAVYLAHPDGTVQRVAFFVNQAGVPQAGIWAGRAALWAASLTAGSHALAAAAGVRSLGDEFTVTTPAGFVISTQQGHDFSVHHLQRLVPLGNPAEECGVYLGRYPSFQHQRAEVPEEEVEKTPGRLLGLPTEWHVWTRAGRTTVETHATLSAIPDPAGGPAPRRFLPPPTLGGYMHVFCSAGSSTAVEVLRKMAQTIRLVWPT